MCRYEKEFDSVQDVFELQVLYHTFPSNDAQTPGYHS